jgi:metal-responsive CopG/Arc/MetJ family transcriptional regulator
MKAVQKVSVALDEETLQRLDSEAAERKTNRSQVVRERLQQAWKAEKAKPEGEQRRPPRRGTSELPSSALARDGAGVVTSKARR